LNTDQGVQFTSAAFLDELSSQGVRISMDGKGRFLDNIFIERLWRSLKYEEVYIEAYGSVAEARQGLGGWLGFYNFSSERTSRYVVDGKRSCWFGLDTVGCLGLPWARRARAWAAVPSRSVRWKIQGPSSRGCSALISPRSAAIRSVRGATLTSAAAWRRLSQGSMRSSAGRCMEIL
jgi:hypothetical protein